MPQILTLPIDDMKANACYFSQRYYDEWGYTHFGIDVNSMSKNQNLKGFADEMKIISCGLDGSTTKTRLGYCIVAVMLDVKCNDGIVRNLACRMFHLDKIYCKVGDIIRRGEHFADYGNTGAHTTGAHLHIEFDTDYKNPHYAVGIASSGNIIKKGSVFSTINPSKVWYKGIGQTVFTYPDWITQGWTSNGDIDLPLYNSSATDESKLLLKYQNAFVEIRKIIDNI